MNVGIIGLGRMGITHYSIINSHPRVTIAAVADSSQISLGLLDKYVGGVRTFTDYVELFDSVSLDAVVVCTPPALHYEVALKAAEKKVHVFSEKPFTTDRQKATALADMFEQQRLVNQVGYVNRFNDVFRTARQFLTDGVIGDLLSYRSEMFSGTVLKTGKSDSWRDSREQGGGALYEVASHAIDLANFLVGKPDKVIGSSLRKIHSRNVEDAVNATFLYGSGVLGTLYVNWSDASFRKPVNRIELFGTHGKMLADQHALKIFLTKEDPKHNLREGWITRYVTDLFKPVEFYVRGNEFSAQLYHFVDCVEKGSPESACSFRKASETLEVIENIVTDYSTNGKW